MECFSNGSGDCLLYLIITNYKPIIIKNTTK